MKFADDTMRRHQCKEHQAVIGENWMTSGEKVIEVELNFIVQSVNGLGDYYHFFALYWELIS